MSLQDLKTIAEENHQDRRWETHTLFMNMTTRVALRAAVSGGPQPSGMLSAGMTEAFEMSAAKNGIPFGSPLFGLTPEIRIQVDENLPNNVWRLVDPSGVIDREGTVD